MSFAPSSSIKILYSSAATYLFSSRQNEGQSISKFFQASPCSGCVSFPSLPPPSFDDTCVHFPSSFTVHSPSPYHTHVLTRTPLFSWNKACACKSLIDLIPFMQCSFTLLLSFNISNAYHISSHYANARSTARVRHFGKLDLKRLQPLF